MLNLFTNPTVSAPAQTAWKPGDNPSLQHDAGQLFGHLLNALPGYSTLGSNITNPNINYSGVPNPGYTPQASAGIPQTSPQPIVDNTAPIDNYGGYGSAAAQTTANQNIAQNTSLTNLINGALGRIPGKLQSAQHNVQNQFDTNNNQLQSGYDAAHLNNQQQTLQNSQQFQTNKNQIQDQASAGMSSLQRLLGMHGAGGSSAAMFNAPNAVAGVASQQNAGAGQNFGQNQQGIDTSWNQYQTGFGDSKKQLNDWLGQQLNAAQVNSNTNESALQQQLLGLQPTVAAGQPQVDRINQLATQSDQLQNFNPSYDGKTPTYTAPSVSSYTVAPNQIQQNQSGMQGAMTPALATLLGLKDKNQQPNFGF